jgi:hypothetical protein
MISATDGTHVALVFVQKAKFLPEELRKDLLEQWSKLQNEAPKDQKQDHELAMKQQKHDFVAKLPIGWQIKMEKETEESKNEKGTVDETEEVKWKVLPENRIEGFFTLFIFLIFFYFYLL